MTANTPAEVRAAVEAALASLPERDIVPRENPSEVDGLPLSATLTWYEFSEDGVTAIESDVEAHDGSYSGWVRD